MTHIMELPQQVVIGDGTLTVETMELLAGGARSAAILAGPRVVDLFKNEIERSTSWLNREIFIVNDATYEEARRMLNEVGHRFDIIIGIGGGKVIDVAKYVGNELSKHVISVPTSTSNDGISSPFSSLRGGPHPYSVKVRPPQGVLVDIDLIVKSELRYINSGLGDLIGKVTSIRDWRLAWKEKNEYYGEYASRLALESFKHAIANAKGIGERKKDAIRALAEALISAGVAGGIAGSSRPLSGSEHLISHALDIIAPGRGTHGEKVALATVFISYLYGINWRFIKRKMEEAKLPLSFDEIGIEKGQAIRAILMAPSLRPERYTILHKLNLTEGQVAAVLESTELTEVKQL